VHAFRGWSRPTSPNRRRSEDTKLQLLEEESDDRLAAARMATVAQAHSEWHRRTTSEKLNQVNRSFDYSQLQPEMKVYFYKPPSQQEVSTKRRKAKHLAHYHDPATVTAIPRRHQLELQCEGKTFNLIATSASSFQPRISAAWMKTASILLSQQPSRRHLCTSKGKSPKKENL
jgi:hypothetical protein